MELLYNRQFEVDKAIILAATSRTSSYSRAFNEIARQAIHLGGKERSKYCTPIRFFDISIIEKL